MSVEVRDNRDQTRYVRGRGLAVLPVCPFVADYIRRHPEDYLDLVVPSMRTRVSGDG